MDCPVCGGSTFVLHSRTDGETVTRRRECRECGFRFSTIETDADLYARTARQREEEITACVDKALAKLRTEVLHLLLKE